MEQKDLVDQLLAGRRVVVVTPSHHQARDAFRELVDYCNTVPVKSRHEVVTVRASNGNEAVLHPSGGWVRFGPPGTRWRGYSCDTLVMIGAADIPDKARAEMLPMVMAAADPQVIEL